MENKIKSGDIYYALLDDIKAVGSDQTGNRPVVILQNNMGNQSSPTVIIAPITSKINEKAKIPSHIKLKSYRTKLPKDSIALLEQIRTIDKTRLKEYIGSLDFADIRQMNKAIMLTLGIDLTLAKEDKEETLTRNQVASYGIMAKENLKHTGSLEISNEIFGDYILTLMELFSPDEIEVQADKVRYKK